MRNGLHQGRNAVPEKPTHGEAGAQGERMTHRMVSEADISQIAKEGERLKEDKGTNDIGERLAGLATRILANTPFETQVSDEMNELERKEEIRELIEAARRREVTRQIFRSSKEEGRGPLFKDWQDATSAFSAALSNANRSDYFSRWILSVALHLSALEASNADLNRKLGVAIKRAEKAEANAAKVPKASGRKVARTAKPKAKARA